MRIYLNVMEMVKEVERDLFEMGTRYQTETVQDQKTAGDDGYKTIELFGYTYILQTSKLSINDWGKFFKFANYSGEWQAWIIAETEERLSPSLDRNPGESWIMAKKFWEQFIRDGKFSYTYGERWGEQLSYIIHELEQRPNSRQAIMTMYDRHQDMMNWGGRDRVPCSLTYQFIIRNEALNLIYNQRSCDFVKFFPADIYFTCQLLYYVADHLKLKYGQLFHFLGSLHAFARDLEGREIF